MRDVGRCAVAVVASLAAATVFGGVPSPRDVFGIDVGADRVLASYGETVRYAEALAKASDRVRLLPMGPTVEGRAMVALAVSTPGNVARLDELRRGWAKIADPRGTGTADLARLAAELPSCALITGGIHASEVASTQAALLFAHRLAAAPAGSGEAGWLEKTVVLIVPSLNPDGQEAVVAWYRKWLGTPYEGSNLPALYHRYAGHDNNRDFVYLTQPESRALNQFVYHQWHPQLFLDLHQMGPTGPRQFVPPFADPIAPNVHPYVWRVTSHLGTLMALRLEEAGRSGVVSGWTFDGNWIGGTRNTGWWKNVFGVLTETASAALATPIEVDANELRAGGKGLVEYRQQVNFPNPWPGGRWGLSDAVGYQLGVMGAFVEFAAVNRQGLLADVAAMAGEASARGGKEAPYAYLVPPGDDPGRVRRLVNLLLEAGVEGFVAPDGIRADGRTYPAGTAVFPAAQPLRQYLIEVLERQHYPEISPAPGADILLPYDITAWSMPLAFGVTVVRAEGGVPDGRLEPLPAAGVPQVGTVAGEGRWALVPAGQLGAFRLANRVLASGGEAARLTAPARAADTTFPPGSFALSGVARARLGELAAEAGVRATLVAARPAGSVALHAVRVGVYHPDWGLEDAGWLRFVLERAGYTVVAVDNRALAAGPLAETVDVLAIPPIDGKRLVEGGARFGAVAPPPEYRKGIGKDGVERVKAFFKAGGTVLAFGAAADWLAETLELPASNALKGLGREDFLCPGAMLEVAIDRDRPLGWGMPARVAVMIDDATALTTRPVAGEDTRAVAARFPDEPLLLSGWIRGEERMRRKAAVVEARRDQGRAVLYAFAPYFRGQTEATFPLLFNAVSEAMADAGGRTRPRTIGTDELSSVPH